MQPISKQHILITFFGLVAIIAIVVLQPKKVDQPTPTVSSTTESWPSVALRSETINRSEKGTEITVVYPVTSSQSVNAYFLEYVNNAIAQFNKDTSWVGEVDGAVAEGITLDIGFTEERSATADNYVFKTSSYMGGAHGLQVTKTFSFDKQGKLITLEDVFTDDVQGLKLVSDNVQKQLDGLQLSDAAWIKEGAGPTKENYQNFYITDNGLTVIFDPYQVAAYAAGTQTVQVPTAVFKKFANPDLFPL
jgi:hypothetical protein